jgi:hypothetical protein
MEIIKFLNPENAIAEQVATWKVREASRGVVIDGDGLVALLHVSRKDYNKIFGER